MGIIQGSAKQITPSAQVFLLMRWNNLPSLPHLCCSRDSPDPHIYNLGAWEEWGILTTLV